MEKFYLYLKNKELDFIKKEDLEKEYAVFKKLWDLKKDFKTVLNTLSKTRITYLVDNWWALSKENPLKLASNLLNHLKIPNYYGLDTANYLNKISWQVPVKYLLINTKYDRLRTISNTKIMFLKFPKELFINLALINEEVTYSDKEKTCLDYLYKYKKLSFIPEDMNKINLYLGVYKNYPEVKALLINSLPKEKISQLR
jgi:hypothetical protein